MEAGKQWKDIFKALTENDCQSRTLYIQFYILQWKYPSKMEAKIKIFSDENREFTTVEHTKSNTEENSPGRRKMIPNRRNVVCVCVCVGEH